ncbi:hypothetical protein [Caballeronia fortuita]|uniref:hypothetical protein n=1 Tax=Caballeronia fortuita TaxID=1777138 RepID=UPI000A90CAB7|nr:hypothetical protein [Caballeronia fortuita]
MVELYRVMSSGWIAVPDSGRRQSSNAHRHRGQPITQLTDALLQLYAPLCTLVLGDEFETRPQGLRDSWRRGGRINLAARDRQQPFRDLRMRGHGTVNGFGISEVAESARNALRLPVSRRPAELRGLRRGAKARGEHDRRFPPSASAYALMRHHIAEANEEGARGGTKPYAA